MTFLGRFCKVFSNVIRRLVTFYDTFNCFKTLFKRLFSGPDSRLRKDNVSRRSFFKTRFKTLGNHQSPVWPTRVTSIQLKFSAQPATSTTVTRYYLPILAKVAQIVALGHSSNSALFWSKVKGNNTISAKMKTLVTLKSSPK